MGRGRLVMKLIEDEKSRTVTFQKRKNGIMKKAHELSTLCEVDCCLIMYSANSMNDLPEIWPQDPIQVHRIIEKYRAKIAEKSPKKYNMIEFFKDRKNKVEAEACKLRQEKLQRLYPAWDFSFEKLKEEQLRMFVTLLDSKIENCEERIKMLKKCSIEEKQQLAESFSDKSASASNRSHLSFMSDDHYLDHLLMLHPCDPNLMPLTTNTQNDSAVTTQNDAAFGHYDIMMRESFCPSSSWCHSSSNNNNNNNYFPYLQNSNEAKFQVNNISSTPLMMQEFQTYQDGYIQRDLV